MSHSEVEVVRRAREAYAEGGLEAMSEYWDPDIDWRAIEGAPDDVGEMHGTAALLRYYGEWTEMFDDITLVPTAMRDLGDGRVLSEQHVTARPKRGGAVMDLRYAVVQTVR